MSNERRVVVKVNLKLAAAIINLGEILVKYKN
jgi:hypothetical protein